MKWFFRALVLLPVVLVGLAWAFLQLPVFGAGQDDRDHQRFTRSSNYDASDRVFQNRRPELVREMQENGSVVRMLKEFLADRPHGEPDEPLPEVEPDLDKFVSAAAAESLPTNTVAANDPGIATESPDESGENNQAPARAIWLGHSSFLIRIAGKTILIDPVFVDYASPVSFVGRRFQPPVITLNQLPQIDLVLISHDHYDHLDMPSISFFADSSVQFLTPLGVGAHLRRWGIAASSIVEKDWWESHSIGSLEFTAAPAQHFSGRTGFDTDATLWASWVIASDDTRLYFSGDSGYDTHFKEIGERLGPFDVAFLENGQYDEKWRAVHMLPDETAQAFEDLRAQRLFPIHWGMFELAFHTWYAPVVALAREADARGIELMTPLIGEVVELDGSVATTRWWESVVSGLD